MLKKVKFSLHSQISSYNPEFQLPITEAKDNSFLINFLY